MHPTSPGRIQCICRHHCNVKRSNASGSLGSLWVIVDEWDGQRSVGSLSTLTLWMLWLPWDLIAIMLAKATSIFFLFVFRAWDWARASCTLGEPLPLSYISSPPLASFWLASSYQLWPHSDSSFMILHLCSAQIHAAEVSTVLEASASRKIHGY